MNRMGLLLGALGAILVLVLFYLLVWAPKNDEIAEIQAQIEATRQEQAQLQERLTRLQDVRRRAPEIEAALAAGQSIIPTDPALPVALRQFQLAADGAGVELRSVSVGQPTAVAEQDVSEISVTLLLEGGYYQIVDFLRRLEEPQIVARGVLFRSIGLSPSQYPTLSATLTGRMFAIAPPPAAPPQADPEPEAEPEPGDTEVEEPES